MSKKTKTVHLVQAPGFDYNDEGFTSNDSTETYAVCRTHDDGVRWIAENGWTHISEIVGDMYDNGIGDIPTEDEFDTEDEYRAEVLTSFFRIVDRTVIRYD